jgi:hypothetical protein
MRGKAGTVKRLGYQDESRRNFIGGSEARVIMGQDEKALIRLWQEKRGEVGPEDLSANHIVQFGVATEGLIADAAYLPALLWIRLRTLTPGPPPFSSMNTMPALTRAASIFSPVSARPPKGPSFASSRLIVGTDTFAAEANCS